MQPRKRREEEAQVLRQQQVGCHPSWKIEDILDSVASLRLFWVPTHSLIIVHLSCSGWTNKHGLQAQWIAMDNPW